MDELRSVLDAKRMSGAGWLNAGFATHADSNPRTAFEMLRYTGCTLDMLELHLSSALSNFPKEVQRRVEIEGAYAPYVAQQMAQMRTYERDEGMKLPLDLQYDSIFGLSTEEKRVLNTLRPESVGMARRLEGVTPSGVLRLAAYMRGVGRRRDMTPGPDDVALEETRDGAAAPAAPAADAVAISGA